MASELEDKFIDGFFQQKDLDLSVEEFTSAMKSLLDARIIREVEVSGQTYYKLTEIGRAVSRHRFHSDPKEQN